MFMSTLAFACMGIVARVLPPEVSSFQKVLFRSMTGLIILALYGMWRRERVGRPVDHFGLALRGIFGGMALILFFYSLDHSGVVKATLYCYTYPVFAAMFAWFDLGERPRGLSLAMLGLAFCGILLTLDSSTGWMPDPTPGDLAGICGGFFSGLAITSVRKLHRTDNSYWIVLSFTLVATIMTLPSLSGFHPRSEFAVGGLLLIGLLAMVAQLFMTAGYRHLEIVEGSVLSLATVPLSALLAFLLLGEKLSLRFWMGAALVFIAAVVITAGFSRRGAVGADTVVE